MRETQADSGAPGREGEEQAYPRGADASLCPEGAVVLDRELRCGNLGDRASELFPADFWAKIEPDVKASFEGGSRRLEARLMGRDVEVCVFPLHNGGQKVRGDQADGASVVVTWSDVTRRKRDDERIGRLVKALDESQTLARTGSFVRILRPVESAFWSDEMSRIWGRPPGAPPPPTAELLETVHPEDRERFAAAMRTSFESGEPYSVEYRLRLPDGTEKRLVSRVRPVPGPDGQRERLVGVTMDVSELRRAESERELQSQLLASVTDSVFVTGPEGQILFANDAAWKTRGYTRDELLAMSLGRLDSPEFAARIGERLSEIRSKGQAVFESAHLRKDGVVMPVEISSRVFELGGRKCYLSVVRDVTERKKAEAELRRTHEELREFIRILERRNEQISLLADLAKNLQVCLTAAEAWATSGSVAERLFSGHSGALLTAQGAGPYLEVVYRWGARQAEIPPISPEACWALRLGRTSPSCGSEQALTCQHLGRREPPYALCIPISAGSQPLGLLRIEPEGGSGEDVPQALVQLAETVAEQISLAVASIGLREQLREQATHDPLTGLYNRRYMEEMLARELRRAGRQSSTVGLLMLDLDHFKAYNDSHGHEAGDEALAALGEFLGCHIRAEDACCRYGGEEFVVILPGATVADTIARGEELRAEIREMKMGSVPLTISVGVAVFPRDGTTPSRLMRAADEALYRAKALGRDRVEVYEAVSSEPA